MLNTNDEQVVNHYHNNRRVTWRVYPDTTLSNDFLNTRKLESLRETDIKLSDDIVKLFKLEGIKPDKYGIMTGAPFQKSSISFFFSNASTVFLTCDQCDETTVVNI